MYSKKCCLIIYIFSHTFFRCCGVYICRDMVLVVDTHIHTKSPTQCSWRGWRKMQIHSEIWFWWWITIRKFKIRRGRENQRRWRMINPWLKSSLLTIWTNCRFFRCTFSDMIFPEIKWNEERSYSTNWNSRIRIAFRARRMWFVIRNMCLLQREEIEYKLICNYLTQCIYTTEM